MVRGTVKSERQRERERVELSLYMDEVEGSSDCDPLPAELDDYKSPPSHLFSPSISESDSLCLSQSPRNGRIGTAIRASEAAVPPQEAFRRYMGTSPPEASEVRVPITSFDPANPLDLLHPTYIGTDIGTDTHTGRHGLGHIAGEEMGEREETAGVRRGWRVRLKERRRERGRLRESSAPETKALAEPIHFAARNSKTYLAERSRITGTQSFDDIPFAHCIRHDGRRLSHPWEALLTVCMLPVALVRMGLSLMILGIWCGLLRILTMDGVYGDRMGRVRWSIVKAVSRFSSFLVLKCYGFLHITVKGDPNTRDEDRDAEFGLHRHPASYPVISNHVSFLDLFVLMQKNVTFCFVIDNEVEDGLFVGTIFQRLGGVYVERDSRESCNAAAAAIMDRNSGVNSDRVLAVYPEGNVLNQQAVCHFKTGAFRPRMPLRPVAISYPHKRANATNCNMPVSSHALRMMSQVINRVSVSFLDLVRPFPQETVRHTTEECISYRSFLNDEIEFDQALLSYQIWHDRHRVVRERVPRMGGQ
ncbi:hypothetical protein KIPB_000775 [Kipferlia bialata]|uniref:Phospholipid/glycerol acyltransferase domain-containing protein n=1 Tax=Kipferlia bialata TaxID=797122 RepID=A0A9K3CPK0_9EUKA|nr:hypothetical protein KIPB_000775 [Kipferlia bialata]|eukprot:g775.t1